jgi:hypothetical protein
MTTGLRLATKPRGVFERERENPWCVYGTKAGRGRGAGTLGWPRPSQPPTQPPNQPPPNHPTTRQPTSPTAGGRRSRRGRTASTARSVRQGRSQPSPAQPSRGPLRVSCSPPCAAPASCLLHSRTLPVHDCVWFMCVRLCVCSTCVSPQEVEVAALRSLTPRELLDFARQLLGGGGGGGGSGGGGARAAHAASEGEGAGAAAAAAWLPCRKLVVQVGGCGGMGGPGLVAGCLRVALQPPSACILESAAV